MIFFERTKISINSGTKIKKIEKLLLIYVKSMLDNN
jgi:hypothetical protein